ncbi:MAG: hypothetical protein HQM03_20365 [Magnetococcales bacterium]|nr:hypothetical protein [Magnetococcales bacterium]
MMPFQIDLRQTDFHQPEQQRIEKMGQQNMITTTHPDDMTADARLDEAAAILAKGILRLKKKRKIEKNSVDKSGNQCPYGRKTTRGERS